MNHVVRYKKTYIMFLLMGAYPPYIESIVKSRVARILLNIGCSIPWGFAFIQAIINYFYLATQKLPTNLFLMLLRKNIAVSRLMMRTPLAMFNRPGIQRMMDVWENELLLQKNTKRRQDILDNKIKEIRNKLIIGYIMQGLIPQLYFLLFLMRPYAPQHRWLFYPHDLDAWYHYPFGIMNNCIYSFGPFIIASYDIMRLHVLFMIESQLDFLREDMTKILKSRNNNKVGSYQGTDKKEDPDPDDVDIQLQSWVKAHQRTLRWAKDFNKILTWELVNKYLYLGTYSCLVAFSIPRWLKDGKFADIAVVGSFAVGSFYQLFLVTRELDKLEEKSRRLFESAFHYEWYNHTNVVKKTLHIICTYSPMRPIQFRVFKICADNTALFKSILSMSYQCLTVIMQLS